MPNAETLLKYVSSATCEAFQVLGYQQPFGAPEFQSIWTAEYNQAQTSNSNLTDMMERTILRCRAASVKVPSLFYAHKRKIEGLEADVQRAWADDPFIASQMAGTKQAQFPKWRIN